MSSLHKGSLDRYASAQLAKKDGGVCQEPTTTTSGLLIRTGQRKRGLVDCLCEGDHAIAVGLRPEKTVKLFKEAIDRSYIHIKFTQTKATQNSGSVWMTRTEVLRWQILKMETALCKNRGKGSVRRLTLKGIVFHASYWL